MDNTFIDKNKDGISNALDSIEKARTEITKLSEAISDIIQHDHGRVVIAGTGLGSDIIEVVLEELKFNYSLPPEKIIFANSNKKFQSSIEGWKKLEELHQAAFLEIGELNLTPDDLFIGVTSSGTSEYVLQGLAVALEHMAVTAMITNTNSIINKNIIHLISIPYKPKTESLNVAESSTILKMTVDIIFNKAMELSGRLYHNRIMYRKTDTHKLEEYCVKTLRLEFDITEEEALSLLHEFEGCLPAVIISKKLNITREEAVETLHSNNHNMLKILGE